MGFDMKNSTFDRFYQQLQAKHGDITAVSYTHLDVYKRQGYF